jgi:hypothetical protein
VEENALLKQERNQLLQEKESMMIELCACKRIIRKLQSKYLSETAAHRRRAEHIS